MAKQKIASEVDEDYIKAVMAADVPEIRMRRQIAAEQKAVRENSEPNETEITEEDLNTPEVDAEMKELLTPPSPDIKTAPLKRRKEDRSYEELFLTRKLSCDRSQCYISKYVYEKVSRFLPVIGDGITLTSYIDSILRHHLSQYKDQINEMYQQKLQKPLEL